MIDVKQQDFQVEVIAASHQIPVLVDFWSTRSTPSRALGSLLEKIETEQAGQFKLVRVDVDENRELVAALGVKGIPNVVLIIDGEVVDQFVGLLPEAQIRALLARHLVLPGERERARAREAMLEKRYGAAAEALAVVLAINPAKTEERADYVTALLRLGRFEQAHRAFEPLRSAALTDPRLASLGRQLESLAAGVPLPDEPELRAAVSASPSDSAARLALADWLLERRRWAEAMDELLTVVGQDRAYGNDLARRSLLAAFDRCDDRALVATYRRRLGATLN